jgi:ParB/RepB/Spo0J family partition protein
MTQAPAINAAFPAEGNADVPLNKLIEWPNNPRRTRSQAGLESTAASIHVRGQLMPMLIWAIDGQDMFYVIDGERRRQSMNLNVDKGLMEADAPVRTFILSPETSEADLIAIATIANVEREQMNPIEEMEAYRAMAQAGMKPREIAEQFNIGVKQVMQRISLGDLVEGARDLVRNGARQIRWAEAMTLGSEAQQNRIVDEIAANEHAYVDGPSVRQEITKGNIPVSSALFDITLLGDCIVTDLFTPTEAGSFSDSDRFWELQNAEIDKLVEGLKATHEHVEKFQGRRFNDAGWIDGGEPATSTAVIVVRDDGSVSVREGMIPPAGYHDVDDGVDADMFGDAQAIFGQELDAETFGDNDTVTDGSTKPTATIAAVSVDPLAQSTRATNVYLEAQIVAGLRLRAATDPRVSMAFVIAQTLTRNGKLASSMEIPGFNLDSDKRTTAVFMKLAARHASFKRILDDSGLLGIRSPSKAVEILLSLDDAALNEVFSWIVSESVNPGLTPVAFETMEVVGVKPMEGWDIDQNYLDTLTNAQKRKLAEEVLPAAAQPSGNASIQTVVNTILAKVESLDDSQMDFVGSDPKWMPPQIAALHNAAVAKADREAEEADRQAAAAQLAAQVQQAQAA